MHLACQPIFRDVGAATWVSYDNRVVYWPTMDLACAKRSLGHCLTLQKFPYSFSFAPYHCHPDLRAFYRRITDSESRHQGLFLTVAQEYFDDSTIEPRLNELLDLEAQVVATLPHQAALH